MSSNLGVASHSAPRRAGRVRSHERHVHLASNARRSKPPDIANTGPHRGCNCERRDGHHHGRRRCRGHHRSPGASRDNSLPHGARTDTRRDCGRPEDTPCRRGITVYELGARRRGGTRHDRTRLPRAGCVHRRTQARTVDAAPRDRLTDESECRRVEAAIPASVSARERADRVDPRNRPPRRLRDRDFWSGLVVES